MLLNSPERLVEKRLSYFVKRNMFATAVRGLTREKA
jgi:ribosomal protein S4